MEPRERAAAARGVPRRGPAAAGDAEVHPCRATLRPGGSAAPAQHGVRRRHAQQPLHHAAGARRAGVRGAGLPGRRAFTDTTEARGAVRSADREDRWVGSREHSIWSRVDSSSALSSMDEVDRSINELAQHEELAQKLILRFRASSRVR